jgi:hypothetical protein
MTKKDYILLANAIVATRHRINDQLCHANSSFKREEQLRGVRRAAAHIADVLKSDNPAFDAGHFLTACGYGTTTMNPTDPALDLRPLPGEGATHQVIDPLGELRGDGVLKDA